MTDATHYNKRLEELQRDGDCTDWGTLPAIFAIHHDIDRDLTRPPYVWHVPTDRKTATMMMNRAGDAGRAIDTAIGLLGILMGYADHAEIKPDLMDYGFAVRGLAELRRHVGFAESSLSCVLASEDAVFAEVSP